MSIKSVISVLAVLACSVQAHAFDKSDYSMKVFGKSLPPIGYVQFCATGQTECTNKGSDKDQVLMSDAKWATFTEVNNYVNSKIIPQSDLDLYGVAEKWTYPTKAGDCEDYVLLKKQILQGMGVASDNLLITVLLDEKGDGHAVLTVTTNEGDFVMDNRRNDILRWDQTNYKFLKRQSQRDPKQWVSLQKKPAQVLVSSK